MCVHGSAFFWLIFSIYTHIITATDISNVYIDHHTLTVAASPYFVINDVEIRATSTVTIENGAEIIFTDNYQINVFGAINSGCSTYNTSNVTAISGLADSNDFTLMRGNSSLSRVGRIRIYTTSGSGLSTTFCNTRFTNMDYALYSTGTTYYAYSCDNCEFINVNYGIYDASTAIVNSITDSYFENINYVNYDGNIIFDHCKFNLGSGSLWSSGSGMTRVAIRNSEILGDGSQSKCVQLNGITGSVSEIFINNKVSNCDHCLYLQTVTGSTRYITNNTFSNCKLYAIYNYYPKNYHYQYNTFINNSKYDMYLMEEDGSSGSNDVSRNVKIAYNHFMNGSLLEYSIYAYNAYDNLQIDGNTFENYKTAKQLIHLDYYYAPSPGYTAYYNFDIYIRNNYFINNKVNIELIYIDKGSKIYLQNNVFDANIANQKLINCNFVSELNIENNQFINNIINPFVKTESMYLIYLYRPYVNTNIKNNTFTNNQINGNESSALYYQQCTSTTYCKGVSITYNNFTDNLLLSSPQSNSNNLISISSPTDITIEYNHFINNIITNTYSTNNIIYQYNSYGYNTIQYNVFLERQNVSSYVYYDYSSTSLTIRHNNFLSYESNNNR